MRYLKNKIALAQQAQKAHKASLKKQKEVSVVSNVSSPSSPKKRTKTTPERRLTPESARATKNIVKNFGKAICKFATSPLAVPYLSTFIQREGVNAERFTAYIHSIRPRIDGLQHFRAILMKDDRDTQEMVSFKKIFTDISEIFIKLFSVNWIFDSKVSHKQAHLNFRFKMLRRIQSPELFTYLKSSKQGTKVQTL